MVCARCINSESGEDSLADLGLGALPWHAAKMVLNFGPVVCSGLHVSPRFSNQIALPSGTLTDKLPHIHECMHEKPKFESPQLHHATI